MRGDHIQTGSAQQVCAQRMHASLSPLMWLTEEQGSYPKKQRPRLLGKRNPEFQIREHLTLTGWFSLPRTEFVFYF